MQQLTEKEFVDLLRRRDIQIAGKNGKLQINAPAGAINDAIRNELSRRKPNLLTFLEVLDDGRSRPAAPPLAPASDVHEFAPLTYAQQRLWIIDTFHPGNIAYNIPEAFRIDGPFDLAALGAAVNALAERHENLRSHVMEANGVALQQVSPSLAIPVGLTDLSHEPAHLLDAHLHQAVLAEASRSFDLHTPPLVRFHVFRLHAEAHVVLINIHHLLADRWSLRILRRELSHLYSAATKKAPHQLPPLPIQYADYARWEQKHLRTAAFQRQIDYWMHKLQGAPSRLDLPFARPHPATPSFDGATEPCVIDAAMTVQLKQLANSENASLFMTVLAAFSVLLYRYTGQEDFCLGSPISGRHRVETEPLIGLFVNLLALRCAPLPDLTFREILARTRATALEAYENADVPFQKLVVDLHPGRDPGVSPLFQIFFALDAHMPEEQGGLAQVDAYPSVAKFDLTLQLAEFQDQISGVFEYRKDLFGSSDIALMARHFSVLLASIVADPDRPVSELALLSAEERSRLLTGWNQTALDYPRHETIHSLFEKQAAHTPDQTAVIFGTDSVTFSELNDRANRIAHALRAAGATPGVAIGICLDRSIDLIASLLGVLKSGAAYVPLDPAYPQQRLAFMVADSRMKIVITTSDLVAALGPHAAHALCIDRDHNLLARLPVSNLAVSVDPHHAAYIIYTSGSTGQPKGVVVEHRNAVSFLYWAQSAFDPADCKGILAATSICFDLSVFELFLPLSFGYTIILAADILELPHLPAASQVTLVNTVPSAMAALLKAGGLPRSVRVVNTAGEFLPSALVDQLYATGHVTHVHDLYGPTETTTYSTVALRRAGSPPTIGHPIANTRIYLLDRNLQPVPTGIHGEIYIAGDGVTRGYFERPDLTSERFLSLAHLGESGRAYKTGDLARYLADGTLSYTGRIDNQVKLRGHRIEMGEIEAVLRDHPAIHEAAVLLIETPTVGQALIAFITLRYPDQMFQPAEAIALLRHRLPAYMVVSSVLVLPSLPLTPNGKLDRKALAATPLQAVGPHMIRSARNRTEQQLTNIWEHCFQRRPIGIDDDFFEIGGHSLLAFQVFAEIEARMGKRLMMASLFEASTIESLAALIRKDGWIPPQSSLREIRCGSEAPTLYFVETEPHRRRDYERLAALLGQQRAVFVIDARAVPDASQATNPLASPDAGSLADQVRSFQPSGDYVLCAERSAAGIADEIARAIAHGDGKVSLILIDPQLPGSTPSAETHLERAAPNGLLRLRRSAKPAAAPTASSPYGVFPGTLAVVQSATAGVSDNHSSGTSWLTQASSAGLLRTLPCRDGALSQEICATELTPVLTELLVRIAPPYPAQQPK